MGVAVVKRVWFLILYCCRNKGLFDTFLPNKRVKKKMKRQIFRYERNLSAYTDFAIICSSFIQYKPEDEKKIRNVLY